MKSFPKLPPPPHTAGTKPETDCCPSGSSEPYGTGQGQHSPYVCYCAKVTEQDIAKAICQGGQSLDEVIAMTGAMKDSNCAVNNPKGRCCYCDLKAVFTKYKQEP